MKREREETSSKWTCIKIIEDNPFTPESPLKKKQKTTSTINTAASDSPSKPPTPDQTIKSLPSSSSQNSSTQTQKNCHHSKEDAVSNQKNLEPEFSPSADETAANYNPPEATVLLVKNLEQLSKMMKPSIEDCLEMTGSLGLDSFSSTASSSNPKFSDAWKKAASGVMWLKEGLRMVTEAKNLLCPPPTYANSSGPQDS